MLIAGWGKDAKNLGYVGIVKCTHCKNYGLMSLYEIARRISVYFIPVAKFQKHWYVVCPTCNSGSEVDADTRDRILRESIELPDEPTTIAIWNEIDAQVAGAVRANPDLDVESFDRIVVAVRERYPEKHATYVATLYWRSLVDPEKPK